MSIERDRFRLRRSPAAQGDPGHGIWPPLPHSNKIFFQACIVREIEFVGRLAPLLIVSLFGITRHVSVIGDLTGLKCSVIEREGPIIRVRLFDAVLVPIPAPPLPGQFVAVFLVLFELVHGFETNIKTLVNLNRARTGPEGDRHYMRLTIFKSGGHSGGDARWPFFQQLRFRADRFRLCQIAA